MTYWKANLLPRIKKYFGKSSKRGAVEVAKSFDKSKESLEIEIGEKKSELQPKIVEIYEDSKPETKMMLKEPSEDKVKQHGEAALDLLKALVEIGCPGAQVLKEAGDEYGATSLSKQIEFLLQKISPFVVNEEAPPVVVVETKEALVDTNKGKEEAEPQVKEEVTETDVYEEKKTIPATDEKGTEAATVSAS